MAGRKNQVGDSHSPPDAVWRGETRGPSGSWPDSQRDAGQTSAQNPPPALPDQGLRAPLNHTNSSSTDPLGDNPYSSSQSSYDPSTPSLVPSLSRDELKALYQQFRQGEFGPESRPPPFQIDQQTSEPPLIRALVQQQGSSSGFQHELQAPRNLLQGSYPPNSGPLPQSYPPFQENTTNSASRQSSNNFQQLQGANNSQTRPILRNTPRNHLDSPNLVENNRQLQSVQDFPQNHVANNDQHQPVHTRSRPNQEANSNRPPPVQPNFRSSQPVNRNDGGRDQKNNPQHPTLNDNRRQLLQNHFQPLDAATNRNQQLVRNNYSQLNQTVNINQHRVVQNQYNQLNEAGNNNQRQLAQNNLQSNQAVKNNQYQPVQNKSNQAVNSGQREPAQNSFQPSQALNNSQPQPSEHSRLQLQGPSRGPNAQHRSNYKYIRRTQPQGTIPPQPHLRNTAQTSPPNNYWEGLPLSNASQMPPPNSHQEGLPLNNNMQGGRFPINTQESEAEAENNNNNNVGLFHGIIAPPQSNTPASGSDSSTGFNTSSNKPEGQGPKGFDINVIRANMERLLEEPVITDEHFAEMHFSRSKEGQAARNRFLDNRANDRASAARLSGMEPASNAAKAPKPKNTTTKRQEVADALEKGRQDYDEAYQRNLCEMVHGPDCGCNVGGWPREPPEPTWTVTRGASSGSDDYSEAVRNFYRR